MGNRQIWFYLPKFIGLLSIEGTNINAFKVFFLLEERNARTINYNMENTSHVILSPHSRWFLLKTEKSLLETEGRNNWKII